MELNGIYTASVKVDFCNLKCVLKVIYRSKWAVSSKNVIEQMPYNVNKSKTIN